MCGGTDISELNLAKTTSIHFPEGKTKLLNFEVTIRPDEGLYRRGCRSLARSLLPFRTAHARPLPARLRLFRGGQFVFTFVVPPVYPHEPPKVKCKTKARRRCRTAAAAAPRPSPTALAAPAPPPSTPPRPRARTCDTCAFPPTTLPGPAQPTYHPNIDAEGNVCLNILREDWKPVLTITSVIFGLSYLFLDPTPEDPLNKEAAAVMRDDPQRFAQLVRRAIAQATA